MTTQSGNADSEMLNAARGLERWYDLKLADGRIVVWVGTDGVNASERYVDCHRDAAVVAWREPRTYFGPVHHSQVIG